MEVYKAIAAVQGEMAEIGIKKDKKNVMQGYSFRGIDDVYNALAPLLAKNNLCILPRATERACVERQTQKGGVLFYVTVKCDFDFVSAIDDSKHTVTTYGEAMDSADKATNKAMSAAYKYAAFQAFCIPVDVEDADAHHHEVKPQAPKEKTLPQQYPKAHFEKTTYIKSISTKEGTSQKGPWTIYYIKDEDDVLYGTFTQAFGEMAKKAKAFETLAKLIYVKAEKGNNLMGIELADVPEVPNE